MKVFLVPVGPSEHVPYCEPGEVRADVEGGRGFFGRLLAKFREVIAAAEQSRLKHDEPTEPRGPAGRVKGWAFRWLADRIAEQRLLWQLRDCEAATLVYPSELAEGDALRLLLDELKRDDGRHRRWLVIDALLFIGSAALALIPGPNVIAYYFAFRVVGHYLSIRGARQGARARWTFEPSGALDDLRRALRLEPSVRRSRIRDIAARLELPHLVTFVERVAFKGA
jgi:hypothetical protein